MRLWGLGGEEPQIQRLKQRSNLTYSPLNNLLPGVRSDAENVIDHPWGLGLSPKEWLIGLVSSFYAAATVVLIGIYCA